MKQALAIITCLLSFAALAREARLPAKENALCFIENKGQVRDQYGNTRSDIQYVLHGQGGLNIFIGSGVMHYQFSAAWGGPAHPHNNGLTGRAADTTNTYRVDMTLAGADPLAAVQASGYAGYYERYYLPGCDGAAAHAYSRITYTNVYPGIDWIIKLEDGPPAYEFLVKPGGHVADIQLSYSGATAIRMDADGSLLVTTPMGQVREQAPVCYQGDGSRVAASFLVKGNKVSFAAAPYKGALLIDPALQWATYYGGSGTVAEYFTGVACDDSANVYACGVTGSADNIATTGSFQASFVGSYVDAFFVKFDSAGNRKWGTYFGGVYEEEASAIASSKAGTLYIAGYTGSAGMATAGSFQPVLPGLPGGRNGFLAKFRTDGARVWSTYYGIDSSTECHAVCLGANEDVYISGITSSIIGIATPGAYKPTRTAYAGTTPIDAFVAKFDSSGARQWGTYYGGTYFNRSNALCTDSAGDVYMAGYTASDTGIATPGAAQPVYGGGDYDGYIVKFSASGARQWATYYGGSLLDYCTGISSDGASVFVSGVTSSTANIATPGSYQPALDSLEDMFLAKFSGMGVRQWGTYYGGKGYDGLAGQRQNPVSCDKHGDVYMIGGVKSAGLATAGGVYQKTYGGGRYDALLAKFSTTGSLYWATYFGGCDWDTPYGCAADNTGHIYMGGVTYSDAGIATPGSLYTSLDWIVDAFLARFSDSPMPGIIGDTSLCIPPVAAVYSIAPVNGALSYDWLLPAGWTGSSVTNTISVAANMPGGDIGVVAIKDCNTDTTWLSVHVHPAPAPVITLSGVTFTTTLPFVSYQWYANGTLIPGATGSSHTAAIDGSYYVTVTDTNGCTASSDTLSVSHTAVQGYTAAGEGVNIWPNPASGNMTVTYNNISNGEITITDIMGRTLVCQPLMPQGEKRVSLSSFTPGVYLYRVTSDGMTIKTGKLIVCK